MNGAGPLASAPEASTDERRQADHATPDLLDDGPVKTYETSDGISSPLERSGLTAPASWVWLASLSHDLIFWIDASGHILWSSPSVDAWLEKSPPRGRNRSIRDWMVAADLGTFDRLLLEALHAEDVRRDVIRFRLKHQEVSFDVALRAVPRPQSQMGRAKNPSFVMVARDAPVLHISVPASAEQERRFQKTFEQAAVGMAHLARDGTFLRVNGKFCRTLGHTASELLTRDLAAVLQPDHRAVVHRAEEALRHDPDGSYQAEVQCIRKDGDLVWTNLTLSRVRSDESPGEDFLAVLEDITARKKADSELALARRELGHLEKLSALGTLVSGVAHEVRTPLAYMANHLQLVDARLQRLEARALTPTERLEMRQAIAEALEGVDRINSLVRSLRRFATPTPTQRSADDINLVLGEALDLFEATHRNLVAVEVSLGNVPPVLVDRLQMQQAILNLLENAYEAMGSGGRITIVTRSSGDGIDLLIGDEGPGVPDEVRLRIFDPFFTTKSHGMGLGLSIVKRIVDEHGGSITVQSSPDHGTTFRIALPARRPAEPPNGPSDDRDDSPRTPRAAPEAPVRLQPADSKTNPPIGAP
ncbi:MAG: two-component system sensor histidine kinase NtrB [Thermoplasmatota archaeon]